MQIDSMDDELRNRLWNVLVLFYWNRVQRTDYRNYRILSDSKNKDIHALCLFIWDGYFGKAVDTLKDDWPQTCAEIKDYFFTCPWYEVYDFIEFVANNYPIDSVNSQSMQSCNNVLEQELSGYRFAGGRITEISTQEEISEIEQALEIPIKPVKEHLKQSLDLLADRKNPDYRNSIKEAISAVESFGKIVTKNDKAELGDALKEIESQVKLHPALKAAFTKLYGYTSNADGIRHGLMDEPNVGFEDAKFMLVSCSAFINYLIAKSSKAGIKI
jgi:hypothetical protein